MAEKAARVAGNCKAGRRFRRRAIEALRQNRRIA
jgi:hypothetical protein